MNPRRRRRLQQVAAAVAAVAGGLVAWLLGSVALLWASLDAAERAQAAELLRPRAALLLLAIGALLLALVSLVQRAWDRWVAAPAELLEHTRVLLAGDADALLPAGGSGELRALAGAIAELAAQRRLLRAEIDAQVLQASRGIERERSRLAALMAELTQAVVVCNLDGRVLLYNAAAREQFRALSTAPTLAGGAELIGLGRSVYTVFDRRLLAHALEKIEQQLVRGVARPGAQFLTASGGGQLLRVQMAPVVEARAPGEASADPAAVDESAPKVGGFVLLLDNITAEFEQESDRDRHLNALTEGSRASLGNLQAAVEMLDFPDLDDAQRERFLAVVRDESRAMARRIEELASQTTQNMKSRWPLEDMLGADLVSAALRRIEALPGLPGLRAAADAVDGELWLKVDSFSLLQALASLAFRLADDYGIRLLRLRLAAAGQRAHLDLVWLGQALSTETAVSWETEPMRIGAETLPLTIRDVVQRHGGEVWYERERVRHEAFFRFLLPLAQAQPQPQPEPAAAVGAARHDSRPEYYDFDLFASSDQHRVLDDRRLVELSYTVFDTETTGLDPAQGDEIIQIGAARVVNGKLLRSEGFEQLVDPRRGLPPAGIAIHGIEPAMLRGQPTIEQVLPAFHAFAQDTVLVAHNAAFDMAFLQRKEAATGLRFDQPVLDTLLLSAVVHPNQPSHDLDAIACRLGVPVVGRHTALGDAIVTAEVWLRLIPLLAAAGIVTLGQAREAAQKTYYARIRY